MKVVDDLTATLYELHKLSGADFNEAANEAAEMFRVIVDATSLTALAAARHVIAKAPDGMGADKALALVTEMSEMAMVKDGVDRSMLVECVRDLAGSRADALAYADELKARLFPKDEEATP